MKILDEQRMEFSFSTTNGACYSYAAGKTSRLLLFIYDLKIN